ncbi:hypothetical protein GWI33_006360 [Rhynchophorus ferrugineus]|uniref:Uncharacterized protein n=1 Tax=Rhynchophorus ferrugineus TaxID=354439 RepID=A0A834MKY2_RHYFE|nr:hypothetical protein GWI33_006360 [Rhynchophorus ferrugineus]
MAQGTGSGSRCRYTTTGERRLRRQAAPRARDDVGRVRRVAVRFGGGTTCVSSVVLARLKNPDSALQIGRIDGSDASEVIVGGGRNGKIRRRSL